MDNHTKIINFMKIRGPTLPVEVAEYLKLDSMIVSAMLSELTSSQKVKMSNLKVGRSRLYFLTGQEPMLVQFSKYLNEKDRYTYDLLKKKQVIRDKGADPLTRVSLRNIKDFAIPLEVNLRGDKELFWKWYLLKTQEAGEIIKESLGISTPKDIQAEPKPLDSSRASDPLPDGTNGASDKGGKEQKASQDEIQSKESSGDTTSDDEVSKEDMNHTALPVALHTTLGDSGGLKGATSKAEGGNPSGKVLNDGSDAAADSNDSNEHSKEDSKTRTDTAPVTRKEDTQQVLPSEISDTFAREVADFLVSRDIDIFSHEVVRKGSDIDMDVIIHSTVGPLRYYCKARKKKSVNDGDLASAFVNGQMKKLPVLLVISGTLTKKAQEKHRKELDSITIVTLP